MLLCMMNYYGGKLMARSKFRVARRSIWYVIRTLLIITAIVSLCLGVFVTAMHVSNLYILATEGLPLRAECILKDGDVLSLSEYFTGEFIENDTYLYKGLYSGFTVSSFDYRVEVESISVLPWNTRATMQIVDEMASLSATANDKSDGSAKLDIPAWTPARYIVSFTKEGSRWYISALTLIEENPVQAPKPTPNMSLITQTDDAK